MTIDVFTENITAQNATADNTRNSTVTDNVAYASAPTTNYNSEATLVFKNSSDSDRQSWFHISGLTNIASSSTVSAASLWIKTRFEDGAAGLDYTPYEISQAAVVTQSTWNRYATSLDWDTGGGRTAGTDYTTTNAGVEREVNETVPTYIEFNVKDMVAAAIAASQDEIIITLIRTDANAGNGFAYFDCSSSNHTDGLRPELVVTYTAGSGITPFPRRRHIGFHYG